MNFQKIQNSDGTKSLFALSHSKGSNAPSTTQLNLNKFGDESSIIKDNDAKSIHDENVQLLSGMDETEILAERQQLLDTIGECFLLKILSNSLTYSYVRPRPFAVHSVETKECQRQYHQTKNRRTYSENGHGFLFH